MSSDNKKPILNKAQKEAIESIDRPVMVIAGPGTGKTTILTQRIANILEKTDTPPSGILTLTFTDSGVKSIKMKLRKLIGSRADEVRVHTFHGFASSIISEFPEHFPEQSKSIQMTDVESEYFIRKIIKDKKYIKLRPLGEPDLYINAIRKAITDCKREDWSPDTLKEFAKNEIERIKQDKSSISTRGKSKGDLKGEAKKRIEKCEKTLLLADVFSEYEKLKKESRKMDYDDLISELLKVLKNDPLLLQILQEKFLHILIDEHQDTNDTQNFIIEKLADFFENPNIFVVGDEKQAIYRFQGASVQNFLKFKNRWKDMKIIYLEENYRSHQDILDGVSLMIEKNYEDSEDLKDLSAPLKSASNIQKKPIDIVFAEDIDSADIYLTEEIQRIVKEEPEKSVAIILRANKEVDHILSLCKSYGISAVAEKGADIFSHPLGYLYFKILDFLNDESNLDSLAETVAGGLWGLSFGDSVHLLQTIKAGKIENVEKYIPAISQIKKEMLEGSPFSSLILIGELSGLSSADKLVDPLYTEVWRTILSLAKDLISNAQIGNSSVLIKELLNYKKTAEKKIIKIGAGINDAQIQIMTAHSSKGLEYDYVFVPYALDEYWMKKYKGNFFVLPWSRDDSDDKKDARRLFYVALTRAREHMVIIIPVKDSLGKDLTPLGFIDDLNQLNTKRIDVVSRGELPKVSINSSYSDKKIEVLNHAKRVIEEKGLSVTAINHFFNCPSEFLYKSILKVPEAPSPSSEKGIAMHKAISAVWENKDKSIGSIQDTIEKNIKSYLDISMLSMSDREAVLEELLFDTPKIAKSLEGHFHQLGEIKTDKWISIPFNWKYEKKDIDIILHGQMDSILNTDNEVLVFDYKTRQAMSENAIKGETKSSDGNYFRQLVFYKILLENSREFLGRKIQPALVFVKPSDSGECKTISLSINDNDEKKIKDEINTLLESVYSGNFLSDICDDKKCKWCAIKKYSIGL